MAERFYLIVLLACSVLADGTNENEHSVKLEMDVENPEVDGYYCTAVEMPEQESYIVGFEPLLSARVVHHMLLYGCKGREFSNALSESSWKCMSLGSICESGSVTTLYAWALQAEGLRLPEGVGYKVGGVSSVQYVVMQVHYHSKPLGREDIPRLSLVLTTDRQPYIAGIYLVGRSASGGLSAGEENLTLDAACKFKGPNEIHPFAFRTHTHTHGTAMYGYVVKLNPRKWTLIGERNPQDPQAFYPTTAEITILPGDWIAVRAFYNTENEDSAVMFGHQGIDEMCNFYLMYYTDNNGVGMQEDECWNKAPHSLIFPDSDPVLPTHGASFGSHNHTHHSHTHIPDHNDEPVEVTDGVPVAMDTTVIPRYWPLPVVDQSWPFNNGFNKYVEEFSLDQITAIDVDEEGNLHILHRAGRKWDLSSFGFGNVFLGREKGPIPVSTILKFDREGLLLGSWGSGVFYLPHGMRIDREGRYWTTDVARHQVLRSSVKRPNHLGTLGEAFTPGTDHDHFCKPADVELDEANGLFYVADGYCNHRVQAFSLRGDFLFELPSVVEGLELFIPHSLALSSDRTLLYVADRENGRIVCYNTSSRMGHVFAGAETLKGAIYSIAFGRLIGDWPLYAVNGSMEEEEKGYVFTLNKHGQVVDVWGIKEGFTEPHDLAVSRDGLNIYVSQLIPSAVWKFVISGDAVPLKEEEGTTEDVGVTDDGGVAFGLPTVNHTYPVLVAESSQTSQSNSVKATPITEDNVYQTSPVRVTSTKEEKTSEMSPASATPSKGNNSCITTPTSTVPITDSNGVYICPRPPPPLNTLNGTLSGKEATTPSIPLYMTLLILGAVAWILFMCFICIAICCIKKLNSITAKQNQYVVNRHYSIDPKRKLRSLLDRKSHKGFAPVSAVDSGSEDELTVFQQKT